VRAGAGIEISLDEEPSEALHRPSVDVLIIDSPPLRVVTDAAILSAFVDGTLLVIDASKTRRASVRLGREALTRVNAQVLGVVLTGMGSDGVEGLRAIRGAGGRTLAESEESCVIYGMPKAAVEAGVVDRVVPLPRIADEILAAV